MTRTHSRLAIAGLLALAIGAPVSAQNLVIDPGFELENELLTIGTVLGDFKTYQGTWGVEAATIHTGPDGPVVPAAGDKMLRMTDDGLHSTEAFQVMDLSAYASCIDSGAAVFELEALFNAHEEVPAASTTININFYETPQWTMHTSSARSDLVLDSDPATWETNSIAASIPAGTRWITFEVLFVNASMDSKPGYVDEVSFLSYVPIQECADSGCWADCDENGVLDFFDFLCFMDAYAAGCP